MSNGNDGRDGKNNVNMNNYKSGIQIGGIIGNNNSNGTQHVGNIVIEDDEYEEDFDEDEYEEDEDDFDEDEDEDEDNDEDDEDEDEDNEVIHTNGQNINMNGFMQGMVISGNTQHQNIGSNMIVTNDPNYEKRQQLKRQIKETKQDIKMTEEELARTSGIHFLKRSNLKKRLQTLQNDLEELKQELEYLD